MPFLPWVATVGNSTIPLTIAKGGTGLTGLASSSGGHPANPATTASTTLVMAGLAQTITPAGSGKVLVLVSGAAFTSTAAAVVTLGGRFGTGGAPAQGAAVTGTRFGGAADQALQAAAVAAGGGFALADVVTGLAVGTPVWFDLAYATSVAADVANINSISFELVELIT